MEAIRERVEKARSTGHLRDMVNWRESAADVPYLLERLAELERALRDIVDEAGPCDLTYPKSKHSHDIIDRPPCCIERGRAALRAGG